jgi:acyl-CoA reductase-like NAD-dependent aldehyde dehydrogenase
MSTLCLWILEIAAHSPMQTSVGRFRVFINHPTMVKADLPFGGIRRSGYGRELVGLGITEFVNHKLIDVVDINAPF